MKRIAFIDTEVDPQAKRIITIGCINHRDEKLHSSSVSELVNLVKDAEYIAGHNILNHDIKYLTKPLEQNGIRIPHVIDTLLLSPLLFPKNPYHALLKDDKLQTDEANNPLSDSIKARDLFFDEVAVFQQLDEEMKQILFGLLHHTVEFGAFFEYVGFQANHANVEALILSRFKHLVCSNVDFKNLITNYPVELAYCMAIINSQCNYSITPRWVLYNYPMVESLLIGLRSKPCVSGCPYCNKAMNPRAWLHRYFKYKSFRTYGGEPLQEDAVNAAFHHQSLLAIFPTGGGKSITFQVPAIMSGFTSKGLTVVVSPLQSLMKDQVDNLEKNDITQAVTINGLLDPIERANAYGRVEDGSAWLLYISPESLRSKSIERLLLGRTISRFVIDEAHCLSSWGQDFRVDYLYIADFIKMLQEKKNLTEPIPVSCFTATAKQKVIEDICGYFKDKLSLDLKIFSSSATRTNLHYKVFELSDEEGKYNALRDLIEQKNCPSIIYVSRTHRTRKLADRLTADGIPALPFNGKMEQNLKIENQNAFISGEVKTIVATSAFGMGVDKKDVGLVVHYDISDSLENYVQEAGRAGRDENMSADCYVLFNDDDLGKHFILLNQTKLSIKEIQQIWKAIKELTRLRASVSQSALEIARKAGWDESVFEIETRVKSAIAALEDAGYLKRGQNIPRVYANSILSKTAQEAIDKITTSNRFNEKQKEHAVRIIKKLFSSKSRKQAVGDDGESRIDYISDHLGIVKEEVINIVTLLREEKILADAKDLAAYLKTNELVGRSLKIVDNFGLVEKFILKQLVLHEVHFNIKELNEQAELSGCRDVSPIIIKSIFNFWSIKNWIKRSYDDSARNHIVVNILQPHDGLLDKMEKRHLLAKFIVEFLFQKARQQSGKQDASKEEWLVEFSVLELRDAYLAENRLFKVEATIEDVEETLFYLSKIEAIKIEGGFMVVYNRLTIERLEKNNKRSYKNDDYQKLERFYEQRVQQIHIVGEYAKRMISDYRNALQFVDDYFRLNYTSFLNKYFPGSRQAEIRKNITPKKFRELFGALSPSQMEVINDRVAQSIVVAAGPGSGKTKLLVHKLASLLLMEDIKQEQLLMLTFSRAAATEFKRRLIGLIGNAAHFVEIKTFHSFCFDLLGKVGCIEKSDSIVKLAIEQINNGSVEPSRITKTVLVIDEAQDMDSDEYGLVKALMEFNEEMRVIAVGDDDQNIYEFRGANSAYLERFITEQNAAKYELVTNYRSKRNLVEFSNAFVETLEHRLKSTPIHSFDNGNGILKLIKHQQGNMIDAVVKDVMSAELKGSTCVVTKTNEEALQICGWLTKHAIPAKLIQSNKGFNLFDMVEVRFLFEKLGLEDGVFVISDDKWDNAKRELKERFSRSSKYEIVQRLIKDFEQVNSGKKYRSDFEVFVRESLLEDFVSTQGETVIVSTIHKAKGKEFDNVFLMLNSLSTDSNEIKRQIYVALTRAKSTISIHVNNGILDDVKTESCEILIDDKNYPAPNQLVVQLSHRDVWLDYFESTQYNVSKLISGDSLFVEQDCCMNANGQSVLKFSRQFNSFVEAQNQKGYFIDQVKVDFILYWTSEKSQKELRIILPEVVFVKR